MPRKTNKNLWEGHLRRIRAAKPKLNRIEEYEFENNSNYENENSIGGSNNNIGHNNALLRAVMAAPRSGPAAFGAAAAGAGGLVRPVAKKAQSGRGRNLKTRRRTRRVHNGLR